MISEFRIESELVDRMLLAGHFKTHVTSNRRNECFIRERRDTELWRSGYMVSPIKNNGEL